MGYLKFDEQVQRVFRDWHNDAKLTKLWKLKTDVAFCIITADGGNQFKMPHNRGVDGVPNGGSYTIKCAVSSCA